MKPYLILTCLVAAASGFLFGSETSMLSDVIEYNSNNGVYNLDEIGKGRTASCIIVGCMIGCALAGCYPTFIANRIVTAIAVGATPRLAPIYIAEISPAKHRGNPVSLNPFAIFLDQSLAFYSNYFLRNVRLKHFGPNHPEMPAASSSFQAPAPL